MRLLETKEQLTLNELLRIAYEYGNDNADMPTSIECVDKEFGEWIKYAEPLIRKLRPIYQEHNKMFPQLKKNQQLYINLVQEFGSDLTEDLKQLKKEAEKINISSNGLIAIVSGSADFQVGDKVKTRGDIGGFKLTIVEIHNDHYCTCKGYGKLRHFNMCFLEHYR